jgi:hypothetical protein
MFHDEPEKLFIRFVQVSFPNLWDVLSANLVLLEVVLWFAYEFVELLAVPGFPGRDWEAILLLDLALASFQDFVGFLWHEPVRFFVRL